MAEATSRSAVRRGVRSGTRLAAGLSRISLVIAVLVASLGSLAMISRLARRPAPRTVRVAGGPVPQHVSPAPTTVPPTTIPSAPAITTGPVSPRSEAAAGTAPAATAGPPGPPSPGPPAPAPAASPAPRPAPPPARVTAPAVPAPAANARSVATCSDQECVTFDATLLQGPVNYAASGLNASVQPGLNQDVQTMTALKNKIFRGAPPVGFLGQYDWSSWDQAASSGSEMILVLSNLWDRPGPLGYRATPWSDWTAYSSWVRSTVSAIKASGQRVDYWDVYNEPGWNDGTYSPSDFAAETPADLLQQFLIAYQAIKAVEPNARIIGPSTGLWSLSPVPPNNLTHEPDLGTFLRFASAQGLQLAAVAWHDNGQSPSTIEADAQATWALIRSLPAIGAPTMILDEYGSQSTQPIPGYDVGYLAAIEAGGFSAAARSCWASACYGPQLDGLLGNDGQSKMPDYFDRVTYASMSGRLVSESATDPGLFALGSLDPTSHRVVALIGRAAGCAPSSPCRPASLLSGHAAPAVPVTVQLVVPWTTADPTVSLSYEPYQTGAMGGPVAASSGPVSVAAAGPGTERLTFTIPAFADGAAYNLTITG